MYQAQILPPGPHFIITLNYMANFRSKNIFYKTNIEDGQKVPWKSASLISNCIFLQKKHIFFCKMFVIFGVFSNSAAWWQNLRLVHIFFRIFLIFWHLCWPWVHVHIEMENLEAKTPCVNCFELPSDWLLSYWES